MDHSVKTKYKDLCDFFNSKKKLRGPLPKRIDKDKKEICFIFLQYLEERIGVYKKEILSENIGLDSRCVYAHLSLLEATPVICGYSFSLEKLLISICEGCYDFFIDTCYDEDIDKCMIIG
jgi:hypothetical protein